MRELRQVGRFEWEQIILRARLTGVIAGNGKGTRGGVSAAAFKAVALAWASHANADGSEVFPGDATLAVEAEVGLQVAQAVKKKLVELGLTERVRAGFRRQRYGDEYRLTLPSDLLDVLDVLTPAAVKAAAAAAYAKRRGRRGGSDGYPTQPLPLDGVGDLVDTPHAEPDEIRGGSDGTHNGACGGSDGTHVGDPTARDTNPRPTPSGPTPPIADLRTAVTASRASPPAQDRNSAPKKKCEHGFPIAFRPDGASTCALCRRAAKPPEPQPQPALRLIHGGAMTSPTVQPNDLDEKHTTVADAAGTA
ncbi:hypothetical protein Val02_68960 [Virgisporangium aliadipatigenens]|uniref:Helix-turn-helix domain-containing protein n=1 Tax=Virgisporangium aliadipatigenens TaxID=741659 RepID=A0A8J3YUC7_9ACTN|nr:hypothetical protein [Virgisporangium aliadipatigenens]GIJ50010.1 hypothetical protein Val02_68960 [Virgisporangium aliadipatigenens]